MGGAGAASGEQSAEPPNSSDRDRSVRPRSDGSIRSSLQTLRVEPGSRDDRDGRAALDLRVQITEHGGRQLGGHLVDELHELGTETIDDLGADQRDHVLRGLEVPVVDQLDQLVAGDRWAGGEQKGDVDVAVFQSLARDRAARVDAHELLELQAVDLSQPGDAVRPRGTAGATNSRGLRSNARRTW